MATAQKNLSSEENLNIEDAESIRVGIVYSEWNSEITENLKKGAHDTLVAQGLDPDHIIEISTPGTFELPLAAQMLYNKRPDIQGIITIGSVIQGETKHFDFVCQGATDGIMNVGLKFNKPTIFCVLTDNTMQQAIDRSGGKHGNKGVESALALLKMILLKRGLNNN